MARQQHCLNIRQQPDFYFFAQKRMNDFLLLFRLQSLEQQLTRIGFQTYRAACSVTKSCGLICPRLISDSTNLSAPPRAEFFQNILRQTVAPRPVGVQKAYLRIQPHALAARPLMSLPNRLYTNDNSAFTPVSGRTAVAPVKSKAAFL